MSTVREIYAGLDEKRRELDALIFSLVGMDSECGGMSSLDVEIRKVILGKALEVSIAEKSAVREILGEEREAQE